MLKLVCEVYMRNIRNSNVKNWLDIDNELRIENPEREKFFMEAMRRVGDRKVVSDFWNLLVDYKKHDKTFGVFDSNKTLDGFSNWVVALLGVAAAGGVVGKICQLNQNEIAASLTAIAANLTIMGLDVKLLTNSFYHQPEARRIQQSMEAMRILYPDLYDIELCFNKVDMNLIKNTDFVGKKAYQEANKIWNNAKEDGKTNDVLTAIRIRDKIKEVYASADEEAETL